MRLSQEEIILLIEAHKRVRDKREADKIKCIIYWGKGWSWDQIKEALFITDGTIKNYLDLYTEKGLDVLLENNYDSNNYKLTAEQEERVSNYVDNNNIQDTNQVCDYVYRNMKVEYTNGGMSKLLNRLGFVYKRAKAKPPVIDKLRQYYFLLQYYILSSELSEDESIYFVDASGFVHNPKIDYGWIRKGSEKEIKTNTGRKKINVNGAYNPKTQEVVTVIQEENINSESNIELIKKILDANPTKSKITLILDNARMNYSRKLKDYVNSSDIDIELIYIPPYSPNLNLIERLWKFVKKKLLSNRYYSSFEKFKKSLEHFFDKRINRFKKELFSLMSENFHIYTS